MKPAIIVVIVIMCAVAASVGGIMLLNPGAGPSAQENQPSGGENQPSGGENQALSGQLTSDFTPPTGKATGPGEYGPWNLRLLSATSTDGLTFTRTNQVSIDQGDVPDLVQDNNGWIYLYYSGWTVGTEQNKTVVAISTNGGGTWVYKKLGLTGFEGMSEPVDPDIQLLSDGTFRLYITSDPNDGQGARTYYAEGNDGINFTKKGLAFSSSGQNVFDPSTILIGNTWHLFAGGDTPNQSWHAVSSDGKSFTFDNFKTFTANGKYFGVITNGINDDGLYRIYAPVPLENSIRSLFTTNGVNWTLDSGTRLVIDPSTGLESWSIKEPAVVKLSNGTYLMVYSTAIP